VTGGYAVVDEPCWTLDLLGGVRYFSFESETEWDLRVAFSGPGGRVFAKSGSVDVEKDLLDAIVGARGRILLGDGRFSLPFYLDLGTGSSDLTWQGMFGIAYSWSWGDLTLAYRHLAYDQSDDKLLQDLEFSGPALGLTIRF
jgi:hypothetical protein